MFLATLEDLVLLVFLTLWMTQCHFWIGKPWAIEWVHRPCSTSLPLHCTGCGCSKNRSCPEKELLMLLHWILICPHGYIRIQIFWMRKLVVRRVPSCLAGREFRPVASLTLDQQISTAMTFQRELSQPPCTKWSKVRCTTLEGFQAGWNNPWARWPWAKEQGARSTVSLGKGANCHGCNSNHCHWCRFTGTGWIWGWIILSLSNFEAE